MTIIFNIQICAVNEVCGVKGVFAHHSLYEWILKIDQTRVKSVCFSEKQMAAVCSSGFPLCVNLHV